MLHVKTEATIWAFKFVGVKVLYCILNFYCGSGFFDIYNEEKGNMDQHAINILNVSVNDV